MLPTWLTTRRPSVLNISFHTCEHPRRTPSDGDLPGACAQGARKSMSAPQSSDMGNIWGLCSCWVLAQKAECPNFDLCSILHRLAPQRFAINPPSRWCRGVPMLTSAECRAQAEEKLAQAEHADRHRNRLITAAEAWLFLANQLRRIEPAFVPKTRSRRTTAWWIEPSA